ncbi:antibiotic biosynthesis monooxygenase [Bacillus sonorensis]|uniref:antibiotic biosynthesis monooxygenase family protein n=1 Tax=Bacillus sonorensis TaxID=119858 RepID=UPI00227FF623|nr:antibiotic biosynthesis monooxygenase [Bacillus sonorensis]MCZ0067624.1 antibiotic biosynthesis monooxygenase [Bacillus sonorensis]MCZ0096154.1 antibiotic biosynthesis monooxygenase [Bacillus sonorensis]MEC1355608.1 antibiotic biosynthesis monooxygenase [Bacillus sonorensis]MEC1425988.1 antibiotic biosynthesis monooxygenase [Bacillus sonorensis]MEC1516716.1 antibiotic biosynthesis monooxygenase [Bacillus sonorensis]
MKMIAKTPEPPWHSVIFTSVKTGGDHRYNEIAENMIKPAGERAGFLGAESVRGLNGITVSYWESLEAIEKWKCHSEHRRAKERGREEWYAEFAVRVEKVEAARFLERKAAFAAEGKIGEEP